MPRGRIRIYTPEEAQERKIASMKNYRIKNREKILERTKEYNKSEAGKLTHAKYRKSDKGRVMIKKHRISQRTKPGYHKKLNIYAKDYIKQYNDNRKFDPVYIEYKKYSNRLRTIIKCYLTANNPRKSFYEDKVDWLGCTRSEFVLHMTGLCHLKGWRLSDYGTKWEIDHIKSAYLAIKNGEDIIPYQHYTNIRPIERSINRSRFYKEDK